MNLLSSSRPSASSSAPNFTLFSPSQNPNSSKLNYLKLLYSSPRTLSPPPPLFSHQPLQSPILHEKPQSTTSDGGNQQIGAEKGSSEEVLVVRRPVMEVSGEADDERGSVEDELSSSSPIDAGLEKFAKKMPIFEPAKVELSSGEKPLSVNLDLALYRAKVLARSFRYNEAEKILRKCIQYWPEDGRAYVALGKMLSKQSRRAEARAVYEKASQATQGENPYVWQHGMDGQSWS